MFKDLFIVQLFVKGGLVMIPITICSVLALAVIIERFRFFKRIELDTEGFMKRIKSALAIRDYADAVRSCRGEKHPVAYTIAAAIDHLNLDRKHLEEIMRQEAIRQRARLDHNLTVLSTVAAIAPLLGLAGTVTGMITSFNVLSSGGAGDPTDFRDAAVGYGHIGLECGAAGAVVEVGFAVAGEHRGVEAVSFGGVGDAEVGVGVFGHRCWFSWSGGWGHFMRAWLTR